MVYGGWLIYGICIRGWVGGLENERGSDVNDLIRVFRFFFVFLIWES